MASKQKDNRIIGYFLLAFVVGFILSVFFEVDIKRKDIKLSNNSSSTSTPVDETTAEETEADKLAQMVVPEDGYKVAITWGDIGKKLVSSGAIDLVKYQKNYGTTEYVELMKYLTEEKNDGITINSQNAYFWVNTLWAMGLVQNSKVLDDGVMGTEYRDRLGNFASTGGWTLGSKDAVSLYSSEEIVRLTIEQQERVEKVASGIYRPCCGNSTAFPDCNHGMAILGLLEIMASQGATEEEMYKASLAFNSYWFTQTYMDLAYYFEKEEGLTWDQVEPQRVLSADFSSSTGYQSIKQQIGDTPSLQGSGGSCGA